MFKDDPFSELEGFPRRIVCMTDESTEVLYRLNLGDRVVGVSGFTTRPKEARVKPRISAFTSAKIEKILALKPDLVIGFSNLQAEIARQLIAAGVNTLVFNQRSVPQILEMILMLGRMVGADVAAKNLIRELCGGLDAIEDSARRFPRRPRVFFEEWMDPIIGGIRWVEELIEIAGGEPVFPNLRYEHDARNRVIDPAEVITADPEVIIASWCGRKVNKAVIQSRAGWNNIDAVKNKHVYEIKSAYILQPGPAALTEGVLQLYTILSHVVGADLTGALQPRESCDPDLKAEARST